MESRKNAQHPQGKMAHGVKKIAKFLRYLQENLKMTIVN